MSFPGNLGVNDVVAFMQALEGGDESIPVVLARFNTKSIRGEHVTLTERAFDDLVKKGQAGLIQLTTTPSIKVFEPGYTYRAVFGLIRDIKKGVATDGVEVITGRFYPSGTARDPKHLGCGVLIRDLATVNDALFALSYFGSKIHTMSSGKPANFYTVHHIDSFHFTPL